MIERIVPATVACAEAFAGASAEPAGAALFAEGSVLFPEDAVLFPEEEALVAGAAAKRRREFAAGRHCARRALAELGVAPSPVLRGELGAPRWPAGIVGSITHCAGYQAAAVARASDVLTTGVDAEPDAGLPDGVLGLVALPGERERLRELAAAAPGTSWDRLLFSAKESVYKAWFPLTGRWLGFHDADITVNAADGTFHARLLADPGDPGDPADAGGFPLAGFAGRWLAAGGLILTAVTVPAQPV